MQITFLIQRLLGSLLTLYMMAILLRWLAGWIEIDLRQPRLRWLIRITDPLLIWLRKLLPNMGPMDWSPIAAVLMVWFVRLIVAQY